MIFVSYLRKLSLYCLLPFITFGCCGMAWAEEETPTQLPEVHVLGGGIGAVEEISAPVSISAEELKKSRVTDVNRALRQAPGVYIREEDGQGLRPNIGLRGTNPDRSKKVVIMEDGILIGPAPYSAPAAYYTPSMLTTERLEVFKGFTALPYGPNSIGGAINYISQTIPFEPFNSALFSAGHFSTYQMRMDHGQPTKWGGYLLHFSRIQSDGFKELDTGEATGFERNNFLAKLRYDFLPGRHSLEVRLGIENEDSDETYLGLTPDDFSVSPYRRYAASAEDEMTWKHSQWQLEDTFQIGNSSILRTTLYSHRFDRLWFRFDRFRDGGILIRNLLRDPAGNEDFLRVLRGEVNSADLSSQADIALVSNDRSFFSRGVQSQLSSEHSLFHQPARLNVSLRLHQDQIERNHGLHYYQMQTGRLQYVDNSSTVSRKEKESAFAQTLFVGEDIEWERWLLSLQMRVERVEFELEDQKNLTSKRRTDTAYAPGLGLLRKINPNLSVKGSINRGVTVAGLDSSGNEKQEQSTNYEMGIRYVSARNHWEVDATAFYNDYDNLTGTCTTSGGCSSDQLDNQYSAGAASVYGLEARVGHGMSFGQVWFPVYFNTTLLHAQFDSSFSSSNAEWGQGRVEKGDPLPYVPEVQYSLTVGAEYQKFSQELTIKYHGPMYDQSVEQNRVEIGAYGVVDWSGTYKYQNNSEVFIKIDNMLAREYEVAARPFGLRPGKPQSFVIGLAHRF